MVASIFEFVEDGIDGTKTNTDYHTAKWQSAFQNAEIYFYGFKPEDPDRLDNVPSFNFDRLT